VSRLKFIAERLKGTNKAVIAWLKFGATHLRAATDMLARYDGLIMAVLTVLVVIIGWLSVTAARDAANAARDSAAAARRQVELETFPSLDVGTRGLAGFFYPDGHQIPATNRGPLDFTLKNAHVYLAVMVKNEGRGILRLHNWRFTPARVAKRAPVYIPPKLASREGLVLPGVQMPLWAVSPLGSPGGRLLAIAIRTHDPILGEFFYTDFAGAQRYKGWILFVYRAHAHRWVPQGVTTQSNWGSTPGVDIR
jgi:hypothetical protein